MSFQITEATWTRGYNHHQMENQAHWNAIHPNNAPAIMLISMPAKASYDSMRNKQATSNYNNYVPTQSQAVINQPSKQTATSVQRTSSVQQPNSPYYAPYTVNGSPQHLTVQYSQPIAPAQHSWDTYLRQSMNTQLGLQNADELLHAHMPSTHDQTYVLPNPGQTTEHEFLT